MPYYGFNFLWMYVSDGETPQPPDERALDFVAQAGFNFVRVPTNYRSWIRDFDYLRPDEAVFAHFDRYLDACRQRGLHMSLNLHARRAIASTTMTWSGTTCGWTPSPRTGSCSNGRRSRAASGASPARPCRLTS